MSAPEPPDAGRLRACFDRACRHWAGFLLLSEPIHLDATSLAQIDLGTRQISLNLRVIDRRGIGDCLEALIAHEVGHHVRYPGSLGVQARLRVLERGLLPLADYSLINLFTDLMINRHLGEHYADEFCRIYRSFQPEIAAGSQADPPFLFYLAIYEELWGRPLGELMGAVEPKFAARFPGYRAQAQLMAQDLFVMGPNLYTQFLYFLSVMVQYLVPPEEGGQVRSAAPNDCGCGEPDDEDWARALTPSAREREAIERAIREGWIRREQGEALSDLERRILGLPGQTTGDAERVPEIMAAWYRQQAERHLVRPPPKPSWGEGLVPTLPEPWQHGDAAQEIDWLATLIQRGDALGVAAPLKRRRIPEIEGYDAPMWRPRLEIYLDVSGSMPDPRTTRNAMTLAAQILAMGAIRAQGRARALMYSSDAVAWWAWCRSEIELSRFLMHYVGGGTVFPWPILASSVEECGARQPIRAIITDRDFDSNVDDAPENTRILQDAAAASGPLLLLLHHPDPARIALYRGLGASVIPIQEMDDFPRVAADLTRALFPQGERPAADTLGL